MSADGHLILLPCLLTLKLHSLGLKIKNKNHRNLEFSPYGHMYKPECLMAYKLGLGGKKKKKKNYVAIN